MPAADGDELYQRLVLDHGRHPRNQGPLPGATHQASGDNPFCGDRCVVSLVMDGERIREARHQCVGCAISIAAASMMTEAIRGRTHEEARRLERAFAALVAADQAHRHPESEADADADGGGIDLGELSAFAGARRYPVRIKCARLPWQTLLAALSGATATISTE
jgi:nitrogen fixation NifU-like protein